jgi:hypothetical protein
MPSVKISEYEIENYINEIDSTKYEIFREYEKMINVFQCTNNFFVKNIFETDINEKYIKICGNKNEKYIEKKNNKYLMYYNINYDEKKINQDIKEINLLIIKKIGIKLSNHFIEIKKLISENEISGNECDELIKDLYFNTKNLEKFNIQNMNIQENKKYLFKIKKGEINIRNEIEQYDLIY